MLELIIIVLLSVIAFLAFNGAVLMGYALPATLLVIAAMAYIYRDWRK